MPAPPTVAAPTSPYRWIVLLACSASFTLTSVDRSTWGPASVFVGHALAVPLASLGSFATAYYIGYVISNALGGLGSDRFGGRITLSISLLGAGCFMSLFGSTTSATAGIAVQAAVGLFAGADYSAGVRLIASWFPPATLGLPMGIFTTATSLGTAIANAVVPALIARHDWQTSYRLFGMISIAVAVLLYFLLRPGPLLTEPAPERPGVKRRLNLAVLARNRALVLTCLAGFGAFWGLYGFVTWANALMIRGYGVKPVTAGAVVAVFAITAVVVKPIIGLVADRFFGGAGKVPIVVMLAVFAASLIGFANLTTPRGFLWLAPLLGAAAYGWAPLIVALVPKLVPGQLTGFASGLANATWQLGSVVVPLAVGVVFARSHSFEAAFFTLAAGPILALPIMLLVSEQRDTAVDPGHERDIAPRQPAPPATRPA